MAKAATALEVVKGNAVNNVEGFSQEQIDLIKNTVAKDATNDELKMFLYLAKAYNLDPFKKEIWFTKYKEKSGDYKTSIITSRDGYLKYAQMSPEFEGLISFPVKEGDVFEVDAENYKVTHRFGAKRGNILGAWAKCDRKGKKPFISYVEFSEYKKFSNVWQTYPSAMIQKVAEVFVLKRAFSIEGLVTREEIDYSDMNEEPQVVPPAEQQQEQPKRDFKPNVKQIRPFNDDKKQWKLITKTLFDKKIIEYKEDGKMTEESAENVKLIFRHFTGKTETKELTYVEGTQILSYIVSTVADDIVDLLRTLKLETLETALEGVEFEVKEGGNVNE
jgi:phage recombination protein Bet